MSMAVPSVTWCRAIDGGVRLTVQVVPNASKTAVSGLHDDALRIRLQARPVEGQANAALCHALAGLLDLPKGAVRLMHGQTSRRKTVELRTSMDAGQVAAKLLELIRR